jgi:hypothetical protein
MNTTQQQNSQPSGHSRHRANAHARSSSRSLVGQERGQALVEFALVLPILLLVMYGIAQYAVAGFSKQDQGNVAREAARYAIINENPGEVSGKTLQQWTLERAQGGLFEKNLEVCVTFPEGATPGKPVKIELISVIKWLGILEPEKVFGKGVTSTTLRYPVSMYLEATPTKYTSGCRHD